MVSSQSHVSLLFSIGSKINLSVNHTTMKEEKQIPNEGVHFGGQNIVQFLHSIFDLMLVRLDINDEHKHIMLFIFFIADSVFNGLL